MVQALLLCPGTPMDPEVEKIQQDLGDKSSHFFVDFMTRTAKFEELVSMGQRFLIGFHQELEKFRRPQIHKTSDVVDAIIKSNQTDRVKAYVEAGCKLPHLSIQNISKLHTCKEGLQDHLEKVKVLLDELECLKEDVIGIAQKAIQCAPDLLDKSFGDGRTHQQLFSEEEEIEPTSDLHDKLILHASMMAVAHGMLKLDYAMQENIVEALNLNTSSAELETYCLMWDLRPFMNDNVMRHFWRFVRL